MKCRAVAVAVLMAASPSRWPPDIAIKLLTALGRKLSAWIRYASMPIQQLETWAPPTSRKAPAVTAATAYLVRA